MLEAAVPTRAAEKGFLGWRDRRLGGMVFPRWSQEGRAGNEEADRGLCLGRASAAIPRSKNFTLHNGKLPLAF